MNYSWPSQTSEIAGTVSISGTVPVSGPLTNAELRASPVPVSTTFPSQQHVLVDNFPSSQAVTGAFFQVTQPISIASVVAVSGPLTDTQLRATPVPISGTITSVPSGTQTITGTVAVSNFPASQVVTGTFFQTTQPVSIASTVAISASSLPLPTGAATSALQSTGNSSLSSIDSKLTNPLPVSGAFFPATQPVSITATVAVSGPLTDTQLRATPVPVSGTVTTTPSGTQTVTGTVSATQSGTWNITNISGTVSLPTGASTSALQTTGNSSLSSIDGKTPTLVGGRQPVDGSGVTQPISAASLPLPTGAATAANQTTANASLSSIDAGIPAILGQTTMSASMPITLASDQSAIAVYQATSPKTTYRAAAISLTAAASPTDIFTIIGSATKTVKILRLAVSLFSSNNINFAGYLIKRSTPDTGGTSTICVNVPLDSANAAGTAVVRAYTVNPTLGTLVGNVSNVRLWSSGSNTNASPITIFDFAIPTAQPLTLRGVSEQLALNFNSNTVAGSTIELWVEWTEE